MNGLDSNQLRDLINRIASGEEADSAALSFYNKGDMGPVLIYHLVLAVQAQTRIQTSERMIANMKGMVAIAQGMLEYYKSQTEITPEEQS
jgi:hypothetical protein